MALVGMESMNTYRDQIESSLKTYEASLHTWTTRRNIYNSLLQVWSGYDQLRKNPIDQMRFEFLDAEIAKQQKKLESCRASLAKFADLEKQMKTLAESTPAPTKEDMDTAEDETIMEIREELDDNDNVINATVTPQNSRSIDKIMELQQEPSGSSTSGTSQTHDSTASDLEPPSVPVAAVNKSTARKKRKKKQVSMAASDGDVKSEETQVSPVSNTIVEHEHDYAAQPKFNIRETADGNIEITDEDPSGYAIGILPQGLAEMTDIVNEMDWENLDNSDPEDEEEEEDEFGRTIRREPIPVPTTLLNRPTSAQEIRDHVVEHDRRNSADPERIRDGSARGKKKLVFAEDLVQGPTQSQTKTPPKSVLKKESSYPIGPEDSEGDATLPTTPIIAVPKSSRFKMERSSTDTKLAARHAQPSQAFKAKLDNPVSETVIERNVPMSITLPQNTLGVPGDIPRPEPSPNTLANMTEEERDRLYPRKANLADVDLKPEEGTVKATLSIPKMSEEELAAIRKKRELLGKKHRRRKSADPSHPVRSSSWDESQPLQQARRRLSSGEDEQPHESWKEARLERAKEIIKAQDDIAWANAPITPEDTEGEQSKEKNPLAEAGKEIKKDETSLQEKAEQNGIADQTKSSAQTSIADRPAGTKSPEQFRSKSISPAGSGTVTPTRQATYATEVLHSPRPRKPPTPERRGSWQNIPSPLRQEIQPDSVSKEVQFTSDVIKKLEPLMENEATTSVEAAPQKQRKMPPRQPQRKTSIDPQSVTPTSRSPPPEGRDPGPLKTEEEGAVTHYMVRATSKSPPPHIAIHDLIGETSEEVRQAVKEEATTPTPQFTNGNNSHASEVNPIDCAAETSRSSTTKSVNGVVEHSYPENFEHDAENDVADEIDDDMHRKEIAHEYHRLRQRMIGANGGYVKPEEGEIVPLDEEDAGPGKRVSRFKAARLGQSS